MKDQTIFHQVIIILNHSHNLMLVSLGPKSNHLKLQGKKVSDSPGLVDFAIGLVNSVFNLSDGQVMFFEEFE